ncbi:hypothetical protein [Ruminococcus sp.]|uniref:hypothetical protein n=1 Tax=Ruminococcus sp. TaxID=41978 RepID=UPI00386C9F52
MNHLTNEEIQQFVSFKILSDENLKLAARVNSHILKCDSCLNLVREWQDNYDRALQRQGKEKIVSWNSEKDDEEDLKTL